MKIRFATIKDKEKLIELALENQAEIDFCSINVNRQRVDESLHGLFHLNPGTHVLMVAETVDGKLAAGLLGCIERYFYSDELQAQLIQWYLRSEFRGTSIAPRLVKAFVNWAKSRGASEVFIGITSGIKTQQSDLLMRKLGFVHLGGNYAVNLKNEPKKITVKNSVV